MTQIALGKRCQTSFQQIHKYETGQAAVSAAKLWGMACALDVPVSYFYDDVSTTTPDCIVAPQAEQEFVRTLGRLATPQQNALLGLIGTLTGWDASAAVAQVIPQVVGRSPATQPGT